MQNSDAKTHPPEPRGFGEHARGLAGEYAHEQGWGLNEEERTKQPPAEQQADGGTDYDYGAQDFGDIPVNTSEAQPGPEKQLIGEDQQKREHPEMSSSHKHTETHKSTAAKTHPTEEQAMHDFDAHATEGAAVDPVPLPDQGGHSHSHAAHLSGQGGKYVTDKENAQNKPEGNLRQGAYPAGRREPPQNLNRIGKQHRGE